MRYIPVLAAFGLVLLGACASPESGRVALLQVQASEPGSSAFLLTARFQDSALPDFTAGTAPEEPVEAFEDGCFLLRDESSTAASFDGGVVSASARDRTLVSEPGIDAFYFREVGDLTVPPGTPVTLSVAGGDAISPAAATVSQPPAPTVSLPSEIVRADGVELTWPTSLDADVVELQLSRIVCRAPAEAGALSVSAALLEQLDAEDEAMLLLAAYRRDVQQVDGVTLWFEVGAAVVGRAQLE